MTRVHRRKDQAGPCWRVRYPCGTYLAHPPGVPVETKVDAKFGKGVVKITRIPTLSSLRRSCRSSDEKDISVSLANGVLTIRGEKEYEKEEKGENYYLTGRSFGSFERAICLPDTVDDANVEAKFDKGVLKATAAKKPEAIKVDRKIEINRA